MEPNLWQALADLFIAVGQVIVALVAIAANWLLLIAWVAWWIGAVNWRKAWPILARGGWAPLVLLTIVVAFEWSRLVPGPWEWTGVMVVPGFWWELMCVWALVALALFCGWLQGVFGWTPPELSLEPPAAHPHGNGHAHAHAAHH